MKRTATGDIIWPWWVAWVIGGTYKQHDCGGHGWWPGVVWRTYKFYQGSWHKSGYKLWDFIRPRNIHDTRTPERRRADWDRKMGRDERGTSVHRGESRITTDGGPTNCQFTGK